ncbi:MAG: Gfo/Idh/MocA family oxidoreductase [Chloroflexota bacterium]|nr:Gfo/Idh/MocA family oxidoreductase [Chloroflexota bacterium]
MKVGIAGAGFMGTTHAEAWKHTGAQISGVVAETTEEARPLASRYSVTIFPDYVSMLSEVDVVDICTPTHLHYEMVMQAAAAGVDIICEKPLARTVGQARQMISACRDVCVHLLVAHVVRFFPEYMLAKKAVAEGQVGRPGVVRLSRGSYRPQKAVGNWFLDEEKSGGILMDLMIHDYDYARWIAGEIESVFAKKISTIHPDAPVDYGLAILTHKNSTLSHIAGAWAYPPPTFRTHIEIAGDAGLIEFDSDDTVPLRNLLLKTGRGDAPDVGLPTSTISESPYTTQIKEFYSTILDGRPGRVTAEDGLVAVQISQAAIKSAESGEVVYLDPLPEVVS